MEPNNTSSSSQIDMKKSFICIPRMDMNVSLEYCKKVFEKLAIGRVNKITETPLRNDPEYKRIMIYVSWEKTPKSNYILARFQEGKNVKLVHDGPWYWKMVLGRTKLN